MTTKPSDLYSNSPNFKIDEQLFNSFLEENNIGVLEGSDTDSSLGFSFPEKLSPNNNNDRPYVSCIGNGSIIAKCILERYMMTY